MHWLNDFNRARSHGAHAFLFTGNVGDSFPQMEKIPKEQPVDQLNPLHAMCADYVANGNIVWIFDPALGFSFPRQQDEHAIHAMQKRKRPQRDTSGLSAIERASSQVNEKTRLPRDPAAAFDVMFEILDERTRKPKPAPCIIIIPDVDAIAPRTQNTPTNIALRIVRFAQNYHYYAAGHILIMTAPAPSSVDERLVGTHSPVTHITIGRPTQKERQHYLSTICADMSELNVRLEHREAELNSTIEAERVRIEFALADMQDQQQHHHLTKTDVLNRDVHYQEAVAHRDAALAKMRQLTEQWHRRKARQLKKIEDEISMLKHRIESEECADKVLTDGLWKKLKKDDRIRWTFVLVKDGKPETRISEYRVIKILSKGRVELSQPLPEGNAYHFTDGEHVIRFFMENNMLFGENVRRGVIQFPGVKPVFELISPLKAQLTHQCIEWVRKRRLLIDQEDTPQEILDQEQIIVAADAACEQAERSALKLWKQTEQNIERTIRSLNESYAHPTTQDIARVRAERDTLKGHIMLFEEAGVMPYSLNEDEVRAAARLMQGCGYRDMLTMLRQARADNDRLNERHIREQRIAMLRRSFGDLLEIVEPAYGWEGIAGLEGVIAELEYIKERMLTGDYKRVPQGILLMGPPGTGKTALAEAWARECDMLFVRVKNLKEPWVGSSEQRTDIVLQALLDLAPCIVLKDEADQMDQGRDSFQGDSGVSNYIRRAWMEFESRADIRGRVMIIKCTNRPDLIDAALMRDQRTDERVPVLMPNAATRHELFSVMARREGFDLRIENMKPFVEATKGLSGANIQKIVRHADRWAGKQGKSYIDDAALTQAIEDFRPERNQEDIARMSLLAIEACSSKQYLPDNVDDLIVHYKEILGPEEHTRHRPAFEELLERFLSEKK